MANFTTTEISGVASAIKWMRFPMGSEGDSNIDDIMCCDCGHIMPYAVDEWLEGDGDKKLMRTLASAKPGSGHDCYLKTITVHFEVEAPHYWWNQAQRYHFWDIGSSTSKMHSIHKGDIGDKCSKWVSEVTIRMINNLIRYYNKWDNDTLEDNLLGTQTYCAWNGIVDFPTSKSELFECILDNTPLGYQLKAGMVTNYLQLKTVYAQRKNHKLSHWNTDFVEWVKSLPLSHLITGEDE